MNLTYASRKNPLCVTTLFAACRTVNSLFTLPNDRFEFYLDGAPVLLPNTNFGKEALCVLCINQLECLAGVHKRFESID